MIPIITQVSDTARNITHVLTMVGSLASNVNAQYHAPMVASTKVTNKNVGIRSAFLFSFLVIVTCIFQSILVLR